MISIIAAITRDNALGRGGDMIYHISADLRRFKELTMGHPIIMGRRTFESFPKGPLPGRQNVVITRNPDYHHPGITVYPSLDAAIEACASADVMVIGGGQIYRQAMPIAEQLLITEIDVEAPDADTHFPDIDPHIWQPTDIGPWLTDTRNGIRFRYITYLRH